MHSLEVVQMEDIGWFEGSKKTYCINKVKLDCRGVIELPRELGVDEPFISTNREARNAHPAKGWVDCPNGCGFAVWVAPK
ncbi:MAG: hypothetical protein A2341_03995 [Deltaproteobacteria bacterium RIFOXYB12_FULL_58_9]|nr:MAG: hypothetical protein A2341_03995 [Deltaproteobacteria bacterium RIFOXYB12_FULL_58_9]